MSKIQAAIIEACALDKPGKDRQVFLNEAAAAISGLSDKKWDALPKEVQKWFNDAADVVDANKAKGQSDPLPDFPDFEEPKTEESTSRRRRGSDDSDKATGGPDILKVGQTVKIENKRGKTFEGKVTELDDEIVVLDDKDEIDLDKIATVTVIGGGKGAGKDEPKEPEIGPGVEVRLITKRGKEVTGEIVKIDDNEVVLKTDDGEEDFSRTRVESITPVGGKSKAKAKDEEPASSRRRASSDEKESSDKKDAGKAKDDESERKRVSNGGVSIGQRIRELIVDNMDASEEQIAKLLKKEDLEFRENTLSLNYKETHKLLDLLKDRKLLKG